ncbi:MAG: hypothetical protein KAI83_07020 [Thiomargarita sp.]|nr:hypothetical protein [Thiomargarita sp.]
MVALSLHQKIFVRLYKNIVVGAILYGCPDSLRKSNSENSDSNLGKNRRFIAYSPTN